MRWRLSSLAARPAIGCCRRGLLVLLFALGFAAAADRAATPRPGGVQAATLPDAVPAAQREATRADRTAWRPAPDDAAVPAAAAALPQGLPAPDARTGLAAWPLPALRTRRFDSTGPPA